MKHYETGSSRRQSRKRLLCIILAWLVLVGIIGMIEYSNRPDQIEILEVNGEAVTISEAMVYYRLMQLEFERLGSENIWNLEVIGLDPEQTAIERVMESIIRVKVVQSLAEPLTPEQEREIARQTQRLAWTLGTPYMSWHCIDRELLEKVVRENYLAYRYEEDARFLLGSNEEEIDKKLEETFSRYDYLDKAQYVKTAQLQSMMFYTGEWVEGEWVSYSEAQKSRILEEAQLAYGQVDRGNFQEMAESLADSVKVEDNPVFAQGAVQNPQMKYGLVYYGQMEPETAERIFAMEAGEISQLMETEYGYLIVRVVSYLSQEPRGVAVYEALLSAVKEDYRAQLVEDLKRQRMEEEWQRLESESEVRRYDERWEEYVRALS